MADLHMHPMTPPPTPTPMRRALARAAAAACVGGAALLTTGAAWALALGPVRVHSALGQPLRAEIPLSQTTPEELASLMVRVAPQEVFRAHGLDFGTTAAAVQARVERRGESAVIALTTTAPVDDLFVDLVLETDWSAGSFARSYTLLLDPPPEQRTPPAIMAAPVVPTTADAPETAPTPAAAPPAATPAPAPVVAAPQTQPPTSQQTPPPAPKPPVRPTSDKADLGRGAPPAATATTSAAPERRASNVTVQRGDTLGEIVRNRRPRGVSMDQMLVAVLQANPDAFVDGNMNRLKAGVVLKMPTAAEASATSASAAREMVLAQSRDFNALRRGLATHAPRARVNAADRASTGRVQSRVQSAATAAAPADKLTLSKAEPIRANATANPAANAAAPNSAPAPEDRLAAQKQAQSNQDRLQQLQRNLEELQGISVSAPPPVRASVQAGAPTASSVPAPAPQLAPAATATPAPAAAPTATPAAAPAAPAPAQAPATTATPAAPVPPITAQPPAAPQTPTSPPPTQQPVEQPTQPSTPQPAPQPAPEPAPSAPPSPAGDQPAMQKPDDSVSIRPAAADPAADTAKDSDSDDDSLIARLALPVGAAASAILVGLLGWLAWQRRKNKAAAPILAAAAAASDAAPPPEPAAAALTPLEQADAHLALGQIAQAQDVLQKALQRDPNDQPVLWKLAQIQAQQHDLAGLEASARALLEASGGQGPAWEAVLAIGQSVDPTNPFYAAAAQAPAPSSFADALAAAPEPQPAPPDPAPAPTPAPMPEPAADAFDLDLDLPAADAPSATPLPSDPMPGLDLDLDLGDPPAALSEPASPEPAPAAAAEPPAGPEDPSLATKLDLAREFHSFGDTEGARALIDEVLASAHPGGTTHTRAVQMQTELAL